MPWKLHLLGRHVPLTSVGDVFIQIFIHEKSTMSSRIIYDIHKIPCILLRLFAHSITFHLYKDITYFIQQKDVRNFVLFFTCTM